MYPMPPRMSENEIRFSFKAVILSMSGFNFRSRIDSTRMVSSASDNPFSEDSSTLCVFRSDLSDFAKVMAFIC